MPIVKPLTKRVSRHEIQLYKEDETLLLELAKLLKTHKSGAVRAALKIASEAKKAELEALKTK